MRTVKPGIALLLLAIAAPFAVYGIYFMISSRHADLPTYGNLENRSAKSISYFGKVSELTDQDGTSVSFGKDGKIKVVNFFFTNCPVICPRMTNNLKIVQSAVDEDLIRFISFSIDPARDSLAALKGFTELNQLNTANWNLVTGDKSTIYGLARNNFTVVAGDGEGDADDFIHSELVVLIDRANNIRGYYSGTKSSDIKTLIEDIKKLNNEHQ